MLHPGPAPGHGGDLADAAALLDVGDAAHAGDWLDLSTGIAPTSYPLPEIPQEAWSRLPGRTEMDGLVAAACDYYGAPGPDHVIAGPGSQAIIERLPGLFPPQEVAVVSPTYGGHGPAWTRAGHHVRHIPNMRKSEIGGVTILVNPNNPDGRTVSYEALEETCAQCTDAGGWLIVDEAFGDCALPSGVAALCQSRNVIALRSLGKFFGLAGLRLGFAVAPPTMATQLRAVLGDWPISGPAIAVGTRALRDTAWQGEQRQRLATATKRLDAALRQAGLEICGGTSLFRLVETRHAPRLFAHLLRHRIYVRSFDYNPDWLRIGIPGGEIDFDRLEAALQSFDT
ncbi:MAG: threonine-phosphate decarboxylase CobD [Hyphomicrobiales bacterium]|nr:threonine-phosphate decarboxylase CobD [Hyphomicrobiales bacterium]